MGDRVVSRASLSAVALSILCGLALAESGAAKARGPACRQAEPAIRSTLGMQTSSEIFTEATTVAYSPLPSPILGFEPAPSAPGQTIAAVEVAQPFFFQGDLRDLPRIEPWKPGDPIIEMGDGEDEGFVAPILGATPGRVDPLLSLQQTIPASRGSFGTPILDQDGIAFTGSNPSDTNGDVGRDYFIQGVNGRVGPEPTSVFSIYDKVTGDRLVGPTTLTSLGTGDCAVDGFGDPIILYDEEAERWLMAETTDAGDIFCFYISATSDPIAGGWVHYQFTYGSFTDYAKFGVWPDAYYGVTNQFGGPRLHAFDRQAMLAGLPATAQHTGVIPFPPGGSGPIIALPADVDGAHPPADEPGIFLWHYDDEVYAVGANDPTQDFLDYWELDLDWTTPAMTTLTGPTRIGVTEFDITPGSIMQQGSMILLSSLAGIPMYRLQYRNFGTHETLVSNITVDATGLNQAGVRWFELRRSGGGAWGLHQEGTFAPDFESRWMGTAAMDSAGNLAIGYNLTSAISFPGIRYAGRLASDPAGTLGTGELIAVVGGDANTSGRYGDYYSMSVDPFDGCTFWLNAQYNDGPNWTTRITSFYFDGCSNLLFRDGFESGDTTAWPAMEP